MSYSKSGVSKAADYVKHQFTSSLDLVLGNKILLLIVCVILCLSFAFGFFLNASDKAGIFNVMQDTVEKVAFNDNGGAKDTFGIAVAIILNNARVAAMLVLLGALFGIFPILIIFMNGVIFGVLLFFVLRMGRIVELLGMSSSCFYSSMMLSVIPHGIFELPIILISAMFGFRIGFKFLFPMGEKRMTALYASFVEGCNALIFFILPVIIIAGLIEAFVTPALVASTSSTCDLNSFLASKVLDSNDLKKAGFVVLNESFLREGVKGLEVNSTNVFFSNETEFSKVKLAAKKQVFLDRNRAFNLTVFVFPFEGKPAAYFANMTSSQNENVFINGRFVFSIESKGLSADEIKNIARLEGEKISG